MKFIIVALLVALTYANDEKIVGGFEPERYEVTYLVHLNRHGSLFCGGALLNYYFVLSAAHCDATPSTLTVTAGDYNRHKHEGYEQTREVRATIPHSDFSSNTYENDIMLVKLQDPINPSTYVEFATLPKLFASPIGTRCNIYGWGNGRGGSDIPHGAELPIVDQLVCDYDYNGLIHDHNICLGSDTNKGLSACMEDSGGPLVCSDKLHGIASWGLHCGSSSGGPNVYTRVSHYIAWIEINMK